jgi:hypothetical protein
MDGDLLGFHCRLLRLLDPTQPDVACSAGRPTTAGRYLTDLRVLACLITATWPTARDLGGHGAPPDAAARRLDEHVEDVRRQLHDVQSAAPRRRPVALYDTLPLDAAACGALLSLAAALLAAENPRELSQAITALAETAPAARKWARRFLNGAGHCSPPLHAAAGPALGARHVTKQTAAHALPRRLRPPPRMVSFDIRHVPAYLPADWHQQHFAPFAELVQPRLLRRAAAIHLARACTAARYEQLAVLLRNPAGTGANTVNAVHRSLAAAGARAGFEAAAAALADILHALHTADPGALTEQRRHALQAWQISPGEWRDLVAHLTGPHAGARRRGRVDWGEGKRVLASAWVWARVTGGEHLYVVSRTVRRTVTMPRVTGGEHLYAPAIRPDLDSRRHQRRASRRLTHYISQRWPNTADGRSGHYAALRQHLDAYADRLAADIDNHGQPSQRLNNGRDLRHLAAQPRLRSDDPNRETAS